MYDKLCRERLGGECSASDIPLEESGLLSGKSVQSNQSNQSGNSSSANTQFSFVLPSGSGSGSDECIVEAEVERDEYGAPGSDVFLSTGPERSPQSTRPSRSPSWRLPTPGVQTVPENEELGGSLRERGQADPDSFFIFEHGYA